MLDGPLFTVLGLGFLLGARHALDADHIAAVATVLSHRPNIRASGFIGLCWGVGHTAVLLVAGLAVIGLRLTIPEPFTRAMEFGVGMMLVMLGGSLAVTMVRERWHVHAHHHDGEAHLHWHSHRLGPEHGHGHWLGVSVKPVLVGMVHGLAGSAALVLMIVSTVDSLGGAMASILSFGLGSMLGMVVMGFAMSVPLVLSVSYGRRAQRLMQGLASLGSIGLGLSMICHVGLSATLF